MTSLRAEYVEDRIRQECYSETIERRKVKHQPSGKYGENHGDPVHFSSHQSGKIRTADDALGSLGSNHFESLQALEQAIADFIIYYNQEAKAIKWTYTIEKLEKKLEEREIQQAESTYKLIQAKKDQEASEKQKNLEAA